MKVFCSNENVGDNQAFWEWMRKRQQETRNEENAYAPLYAELELPRKPPTTNEGMESETNKIDYEVDITYLGD